MSVLMYIYPEETWATAQQLGNSNTLALWLLSDELLAKHL